MEAFVLSIVQTMGLNTVISLMYFFGSQDCRQCQKKDRTLGLVMIFMLSHKLFHVRFRIAIGN